MQVSYGKALLIDKRLFYVGGISLPATIGTNIYEWTEQQGWTLFKKVDGFSAGQYFAAIPYNF